ncbi:MAG TPA: MgtC/SapB family protein [Blastocatellia bacterium]|jgi:putative Mg2+ transporter-C (MgtC) family protein
MNLPDIDWSLILSNFISLAIAYVLALPVAWNREKSELRLGLRTFPLVAISSCGYVLLSARAFGSDSDAMARIIQGLITGIGFIGGGAILKQGANVLGTATAASIWSTGAIGGAVAFGRYEIAIVLSVMNFATLRWLTPLKHSLNESEEGRNEK